MRQQSRIQVRVRGAVIGGPKPLICMPLFAKDRDELLRQAIELSAFNPDMFEWRVDGYARVAEVEEILSALDGLRLIIAHIPLIFTCRIDREGGAQHIAQPLRQALISAALASGNVDLIDIELCNEEAFISAIRGQVKACGCKLILSYHNFQETPGETFLVGKLQEAEAAAADIAKLAVMPKNYSDVLTLLTATNRARNGAVAIPLVTMAMGHAGRISRMAGGLFGSDITFAGGSRASAPGQIPIETLRAGMTLFFEP